MRKWIVQTDGGCPQNPGPGAWAFVVKENGITKLAKCGYLPSATNNQAEYRAVTAAALFLYASITSKNEIPNEIEFWGDSQLIIYQLTGKYKVGDITLKPFYSEALFAIQALRKFTKVTLNWFRRENNHEADELCNQILERHGVVLQKKRNQQVAALLK